ncbi:MAG: alpha/beta hydrolase [Burkholderiaceae bacterium]
MAQLILLPGLASNAVMWEDQLAALPAELGAHVTDVHAREDSIEAMAAALLREHPGPLILCGASMGGIVAMEVLHQAPERILGLALLGTNPRPEAEDMRRLREAAIVFFEQGRAGEILRANVPLAFHASRANDTALTDSYMAFVMQAGATQLVRQNRAIITRPDARLHLGVARCPVLILCGDSDQLTPPEYSQEMAALIPHAQLVMVPQCGHMLTMEQPEFVNRCLIDWLRTLRSTPA